MMKKKTTLRITYLKTQLQLMDKTLSDLTGSLSTEIINTTQFIIRYNPRGGYYNVFIQCISKKNAMIIKNIFESKMVERVFDS